MATSNTNLPITTNVTVNKLRNRILRPSLTSTYSVFIEPIQSVTTFLKNQNIPFDRELLELSCSEASLPGSSIATIDINNDYMGVTEKHAYRRLYDDRADFTFYVTLDNNITSLSASSLDYNQIRFFDGWMKYITNEQYAKGVNNPAFVSRVQFPDSYKSTIRIVKYEKDYGTGRSAQSNILAYEFLGAYPVSINSIPVSYDSSSLLKVTVSFVYTRYFITQDRFRKENPSTATPNSAAPGVAELRGSTPTESANRTNANDRLSRIENQINNDSRLGSFDPRGLGQSSITTSQPGEQQTLA